MQKPHHPALVITGMHRSGTSLVASLFHSAGLNIGARLMGPGPGNVMGHFEDLDFVEFHMKTLQANGCHTDGFITATPLAIPVSLQTQASSIIESRRLQRSAWGWKDPRTVLFLDFWRRLLPESTFVFLVRSPWEVIDSIFRRNDVNAVRLNPVIALQAYQHYYTIMRDFIAGYSERCIVCHIADILKDPEHLLFIARERLGLPVREPQPVVRRELFNRLAHSSKRFALKAFAPRCIELYEELRDLSRVHKPHSRRRGGRAQEVAATRTVSLLLEEWSREHDVRRGFADCQDRMNQVLHSKAEVDAALAEARLSLERQAGELAEEQRISNELKHCVIARDQTISDLSANRATLAQEAQALGLRLAAMELATAERDRCIADLTARCATALAAATASSDRLALVEVALAERDLCIADLSARCAAAVEEAEAATVQLASIQPREQPTPQVTAESNDHLEAEHRNVALGNPDSREPDQHTSVEPEQVSASHLHGQNSCEVNGIGEERGSRQEVHSQSIRSSGANVDPSAKRCAAGFLVPYTDVFLRGSLGDASSWLMTGHDPAFLVDLPGVESLTPGHYEFLIQTVGDAQRITLACRDPALYFDHGTGFREVDSIKIPLRPRAGCLRGRFVLPIAARRLRFDPSTRPGELTIGAVSVRRISRARYYAMAAADLAIDRLRRGTLGSSLRRAIQVWCSEGVKGVAAAVRQADRASPPHKSDYLTWLTLYDSCTSDDVKQIRALSAAIVDRPMISVIMPTFNTTPAMLREAVDSVLAQAYDRWELCIADDCSTKRDVRVILEQYAARDSRVKVVFRETNGHIAEATNTAIAIATGDWICFLDHDDVLTPDALYCVADAIRRNPSKQVIYSDEDKLDANGCRCDPYFKSDWNPDLFLSHNLITHLAVYRSQLVRDVGGMRPGFDGAQDYDLALRIIERINADAIHHIPHVLYHWRVHAESTASGGDAKPYAMLAGERALQEHLKRRGVPGRAILRGIGYQVEYEYPSPAPLASIIIPTRNAHELTRHCIDSIRTRTENTCFEIVLVDNGSDDPESCEYFKSLAEEGVARVVCDPRPFNYSALNNLGVRYARGEVLVLLNNDIEVITPTWLRTLVSIAIQPGVGAVGAKLLYPDGTLQHGGVILGLGGLAAHAHGGFPRSSMGYVGRAALQQSFSAVTGACLAVRRETYLKVGGLDELELPVAYNDVDFCLKLLAQGLRNVWTPYAELYHHESATRGYETTPEKRARQQQEMQVIRRRWQRFLDHDPAYSPNLTDSTDDFSLAWPPRVRRPWCAT